MDKPFTDLARDLGAALLLGLALALALPQAYAGIITLEDVERTRIKAALERPELAAELARFGVAGADAQARVDALTPAEVQELAGRIDALAAGGQSTTRDRLLVLLVILLAIAIFV